MEKDKFLLPLQDEIKDFYCWRLYKNGYTETEIKDALIKHTFLDSQENEDSEETYSKFIEKRMDYLENSETNPPTRTRYSFVIAISKHLGCSREQGEFWVQLYEKTRRKDKTSWPSHGRS